MRQATSRTKRKANRAKAGTRHKWWTKEAHAERVAEAERLASLVRAYDDPARREAYDHYCSILNRAMEGVVWTPDRVRALYPTLKEIVDEIDEITQQDKRSSAAMRGWQKRKQREEGSAR